MSKYMRYACIPAVLFALAACSHEKNQDTLAQDTSLNKDIQLANSDTAAQPALNDVPPAAAPAAARLSPRARNMASTSSSSKSSSASSTTPKSTAPRVTASGNTVTSNTARETPLGTVSAGTTLNLASTSQICTNTNKVGQTVTATTTSSVTGSNGAVIPAGARVALEITELHRSENVTDKIQMGFAPRSVTFGGHTYPITATVNSAQVNRVKNQPGSKDVQKVGTGAAVGAIVGQILGKSTKSTIIGGAIGAAAGAGAAATTSNYEGCVPSGGQISITLSNSVQVHT